jgi:hypothetical protein
VKRSDQTPGSDENERVDLGDRAITDGDQMKGVFSSSFRERKNEEVRTASEKGHPQWNSGKSRVESRYNKLKVERVAHALKHKYIRLDKQRRRNKETGLE